MTDNVAIEALKALAHPLRFRILQVLKSGERNVGEIEQLAGIGQPALSQQLSVLRKAGLVATRKESKLVYYQIAGDRLAQLTAEIGDLVPVATDREETDEGQAARRSSPGFANFARLS